MAYNFLAVERDQLFLLPPSLLDWLPEDHLAWFVLDAVAEMDLDAFYAGYGTDGWGGAAHEPSTMVALLLYAYCQGVRSSRQIERACHVDVAVRVIAANQTSRPHHDRPLPPAPRRGPRRGVLRLAASLCRGRHGECGHRCSRRNEDGVSGVVALQCHC